MTTHAPSQQRKSMNTPYEFNPDDFLSLESYIIERNLSSAEVYDQLISKAFSGDPEDIVDKVSRLIMHEIAEDNVPAHKIPTEFFRRFEEKGKRAAAIVTQILSQGNKPPQ